MIVIRMETSATSQGSQWGSVSNKIKASVQNASQKLYQKWVLSCLLATMSGKAFVHFSHE